MSEEILKVLEKLKNKSNYQRDCNDGSYFIELFANEIYILCKFMEDLQQKVEQLEKEIDRLNNIINELEKYINKLMGQTRTAIAFNKGINDIYETKKYERDNFLFEMILDKLKELKENE